MPRVPTYERTQTLRPSNRQDITVQATPGAFGADIGRGLQQAGGALGQAADAVAAVKAFDNENAAKDQDNAFANWARERMYGEGGYLTLEGRNAVDAREQFDKDVEAKRKEFGASLQPGAARLYDRASQARAQSLAQQAIVHQAQQRKTWFGQTSEARVAGFANDALAAYTDPAQVQKNIAAGLLELDNRGQMSGWSPEQLAQQKSTFTSGVHSSVVMRMADTDPLAADKYLKDNKDAFLPADAMKLHDALEQPLLAAKAERNVRSITSGGLPQPKYDKSAGVVGTEMFRQTAGGLMGLNENSATGAIKDFISRSAGVDIDPRVTPWCAAFVNAVLGSQGVKGTGSLAARSFLNFGMGTDAPKPGDIVVLSRGSDASKGHVGFFQGYDQSGNILVLGGNQGAQGSVSVSAFPKSQLLGFRTAGNVDAATAQMPNYNPASLAAMYDKANAISDPKERDATLRAIDAYYTRQKRGLDASRQDTVDGIEKRMIADPSFDPSKLPVSMQQVIGMSGMNALIGYRNARITEGKVKTDPVVMDGLLQEQAFDPDSFAKKDLLPYRAKLSDSDWLALRGKQRAAVADLAKEQREGSVYRDAFTVAKDFYSAAGIKTGTSKAAQSDTNKQLAAQFNGAMRGEVDEFIQREKRKPTYDEMRTIASALTLKAIGSETRSSWSPMRLLDDDQDDVWTGRAFQRGDMPAGLNKRIAPSFADVPPEWVGPIKSSLTKKLGRAPTNSEVANEWGGIAMSMIGSN